MKEGTAKISLKALLWEFLKIGTIGFGGGMSIIALIEKELIKKRNVIDLEEFLHGIAFGQILGPFAVNTAIFIAMRLYGFVAGILSAVAFMLPSVILVIILSQIYFAYHTIPSLQTALVGLGPVVIALIISAAWSMGKKALKNVFAHIIALLSLLLSFYKINTAYILIFFGLIGIVRGLIIEKKRFKTNKLLSVFPFILTGAKLSSLPELFINFFKTGLVFFGGGFVLVPILHEELVTQLKWLTEREFIDGVAISNLTPGPIAVLATFAGYKVYGVLGAIISTSALFLPGVILMLFLTKGYNMLKDVTVFQYFLSGVTPAVIGLVVNAALKLAPSSLINIPSYVLFVISLPLLIKFKWHPAFVLAIGAVAGMLGVIQ